MSLEEVKELCSQHLVYLSDMGFEFLVKDEVVDGRLTFTLSITKPFYTQYDAYKYHDVECELSPLHTVLSKNFDVKEMNLWTVNEKYILSRHVASNLIAFEYDSNFMEVGISYG